MSFLVKIKNSLTQPKNYIVLSPLNGLVNSVLEKDKDSFYAYVWGFNPKVGYKLLKKSFYISEAFNFKIIKVPFSIEIKDKTQRDRVYKSINYLSSNNNKVIVYPENGGNKILCTNSSVINTNSSIIDVTYSPSQEELFMKHLNYYFNHIDLNLM